MLGIGAISAKERVPLPRPKPGVEPQMAAPASPPTPEKVVNFPPVVTGPTACEIRLGEIAAFEPLPTLLGPGSCGANDVVRLDAIVMAEKRQIPLNPPAILRCSMAEAVAHWVRNDIAPATGELGSPLAAIANFDSYDCRGRNRLIGAKLSEHGRGNALDIRSIRLQNGTVVELTSLQVSKEFRTRLRTAACARFMTVLGPGSDGYHENHIHVDLAERRGGYRMCQWDIREPMAAIPLPQPKPAALTEAAEEP
jgi:hypothetical protein